jgi:fructose-1,6-bisphosphatase/sedoheptulose 1,7-bisphosphatase-like protein
VEQQFMLYRNTRERVKGYVAEVREAGSDRLRIIGEGDVADICRLTCMEQGITVTTESDTPSLEVLGLKVILHLEVK